MTVTILDVYNKIINLNISRYPLFLDLRICGYLISETDLCVQMCMTICRCASILREVLEEKLCFSRTLLIRKEEKKK